MHAHLNQIIADQHSVDLHRAAAAARRSRPTETGRKADARRPIARLWLRFHRPDQRRLPTAA